MLTQCYFDGAGAERQLGRTVASRLLQHLCSNITDMQNARNKLTILLKFSNFNTDTYRKCEDPTLCGCCGELFLESSSGSLTRWVALPPQAQRRTISTCGLSRPADAGSGRNTSWSEHAGVGLGLAEPLLCTHASVAQAGGSVLKGKVCAGGSAAEAWLGMAA